MKRILFATAAASALLFVRHAAAAPPATAEQRLVQIAGAPAVPPSYSTLDLTVVQAKAQIGKIAAWDVTMQSTACVDPDAGVDASPTACEAGGIIEVESGPGMSIVASDNTQETIGIWNIDKQLNAMAYPTNIADAFKYLSIHPGYLAWELTGDPGPDYYSVYNCGWGVRAVMLYESVTGDMSHHAYGVTCAQHIAMNAGGLVSAGAPLLDVGPAGWAASGLWLWGQANSDAASKTTAASIGAQVKAWIEATPGNAASQQWAMSGGAPYCGVIESYMKENPSELTAWVTEYAPMLGGWVDESTPASPNDWTDWRNAWNAWNMLAQFTSAEVLGTAGATNQAVATDILNKLVAQANPTTGAIAGSQQRPSTEAESWITAYLVYFGLLEVIDHAPPAKDAGPEGGSDAGLPKDAGRMDAAPPRDSGKPPPSTDGSSDAATNAPPGSGGCSCTQGPRRGARDPWLSALAVVGLASLLRRSRRAS